MADPFELKTADPRFDPRKPVEVNGYLYFPHADQWREAADQLTTGDQDQ